jgi:hypothetical protein
MIRLGGAALAAVAAAGRLARADTPVTSPISGRDYAVELYDNVALGNSQTIAMGGAAVANAAGSSGTLINVSAPAVRPTTDRDRWSLDVHFDALSSSLSTDAENSGLVASSDSGGVNSLTAGIALRVGDWAGALTGTLETTQVVGNVPCVARPGCPVALQSDLLRGQVALARWLPRFDLAIGAALDLGEFSLSDPNGQLFAINAVGGEAGATWIPTDRSLRLGVNAQTGLSGGALTASSCNPLMCDGYILPEQIVAPWLVAVGAAYRIGPTPWNILYPATFRDEHAVTFVADLVVIGSIPNSDGLEAWGFHELQRESEHVGVSPRAGAEYEALPGRLRLRAGTYYEPGLLEGASGRAHVTFGTEVMLFPFSAWGLRRAQLTLTGDIASRYRNASVSVGFWH